MPMYLIELARYTGFAQLFFIITSFIIVYGIHHTLRRYSKDYLVSLLIFISVPHFYLSSFGIVRQYCAIAILFYGIKYIVQRNFYYYLAIVALAMMFHYSAIIGIVFYFLYRIELNRFITSSLIIASFFTTPVLYYIIEHLPKYSDYILPVLNRGTGAKMQLFLLLSAVIFMFFYNSFKSTESKFYYNVFIVGVCTYNAFLFIGDFATRISYYFIIYLILLIPELKYKFEKKQFYLATVLFSILLYATSFYLSYKEPTKNALVPYQIFLSKSVDDIKLVK
ncbi:MAG: hypothetical protein Ctma_0624 [Catillopecten margaritatus gill symbiont]|uniref:EpsG family protein n=1 Tax=Catillopecten margaritatus gill symbiont TaxID=3083288 RepID=A0AAU6PFZ6_9GAMM